MKSKPLILTLLILAGFKSNAQILRVVTSPTAIVNQVPGYSQVSTIATKTVPYTPSTPPPAPTPVDEDSTTESDHVYRYADVLPVSISMADGNITSTTVGKVWTLRISIPNALNIGFVFNQFNLSSTAQMFIFNEPRTVLDSSIRAAHFTNLSQVGILPFSGNSIILYIVEPNNFGNFNSSINITKLEAGFLPIEDAGETGNATLRGVNCIPQVACSDKMNAARAVAKIFVNGSQGTGTLLNNENNDGRAYFLTAWHVVDDPWNAASIAGARFTFQFWRPYCSSTVNEGGITFSGAVTRGANKNSDGVLLELTNPPGVGDGVNYAGWNRTTSSPADNNSYIIHHPEGKDMRITTTRRVKSWLWNSDFWTAHYNSGVVTPGSSGSALFSTDNLVVGQLRGGWSSCNFTDFGDRYGKFHKSYDFGGFQTWLSPANNYQAINGLILNPLSIEGPNVIPCSGGQVVYRVPNLRGCTYTWSIISNAIQIVSGQGTATVVIARNGSTAYESSALLRVTIQDSKGLRRTVTVDKIITVGPPDLYQLSIVMFDKPCTSEISVGVKYYGQTGCNLANYDVVEAEYQIYNPYPYTLTENAGSYTCSNPSQVKKAGIRITVERWRTYTIAFLARVKNKCGMWSEWTPGYYYHVNPSCTGGTGGGMFRVTPNPATSSIEIQLEEGSQQNAKSNKTAAYRIEITDKLGVIRKQFNYSAVNNRMILNVGDLKPDVYIIKLFNGKEWKSQFFIKK